ncbi:hypothetical protein AAIR98_000845 [Elusimicrobium simillimum]|uniref:LEA type 2 family protein n=1 Tax=Elusimicrobium simillimum TaxID=3143438 RepID=UPI003C6EE787
MNKKIILGAVLFLSLFGCATLQENYNMVNCKYDITRVEMADINPSSINMNIIIAINNVSRTTDAALSRFEGDLYINDTNVSKFTLKDVRVPAGSTEAVKSSLEIPFASLGKTLTGLVTMGSVSVDYKVKGTMYFATPLGDVPYPVTIYQSKKF